MISISLKLDGNLKDQGFRVNLEIQSAQYCIEKVGNLCDNPELDSQLTRHWQNYRKIYAPYRGGIQPLEIDAGTRRFDCQASAKQLSDRFNQWLNSPSFQAIDQMIREQLSEDQLHQLIIRTQDAQLLKLPWEKWTLFDKKQLIVKFLPLESKSERVLEPPKIKKVLAILGHKKDLNLEKDRHSLEQWTKQQIYFLDEPSFQQLNDYLWKESWDMIFFAGHSETKEDQGRIYLNSQESLTVDQLEHALQEARKKGLKLAIFNSCDGIGLAKQLESLSIPHVIVMRELIPDQVAHHFLIYFLENFTEGQSFEISVQKAQQRLQGLETQFPCATWLPLIYQKPRTLPPSWEKISSPWQELGKVAGKSALATGLVMGLRWMGLFQGLELTAYDTLMQQRPAELIDSRIVVVEITDEDISRYGYPLPDEKLKAAIAQLNNANPRVIGIDIHRSDNQTSERQQLIQSFAQNHNIIPVCSFNSQNSRFNPHPDLPLQQYGFSDLLFDARDKVRRQLMTYNPNRDDNQSLCATPYSFSWQLAYRYLNQDNISPLSATPQGRWQFGEVIFPRLGARFSGYQTLDRNMNQMMINYRSKAQAGQKISLSDLLDGHIKPKSLENKVILLGYGSSDAVPDEFDTPIGRLPGVWIHANMTSQMISAVLDGRSLIQAFSVWGDALWIFAGSMATGILIWGLKTYLPKYAIFSSILSFGIISLILYAVCRFSLPNGFWLPWIPTQFALLLILGMMLMPRLRQFSVFSKAE